MNRVLIAAADVPTAESVQASLSSAGFQTAVVWNASQLLDFCKQHSPDALAIDLDLPGGSIWAAIQALRTLPGLAGLPIVGIGQPASEMVIEHARSAGMLNIFAKSTVAQNLPEELHALLSQTIHLQEVQRPATDTSTIPGNSPMDQLQSITSEVIQLAARLKPQIPHFGPDGPELFGYIDTSSAAIREKLSATPADGLHDKEIRHDFRNMIGSVTGFAELIMMEPNLAPETQSDFARIRECSRVFIQLLDEQKAAAA